MTRDECVAALADIPIDEALFIVRGSHPAAPETLREYARRTLHAERVGHYSNPHTGKAAREEADRVFALADQMEQSQAEQTLQASIEAFDREQARLAAEAAAKTRAIQAGQTPPNEVV